MVSMVNPFEEYVEALKCAHAQEQFLRFQAAFNCHNRIIILGNGGSSSVASHWCEDNKVSYGVLTGFECNNRIRTIAVNALWNYWINSRSYGVVECVHQIFLHGVV